MRPLQEVLPFDRIGLVPMRNHRALGQMADIGLMPCKALSVEFQIKFRDLATPDESFCLPAAAEKAGPVAGGESCDLIKEKE